MAKKVKCPEFENHERWLIAFADMMTLLFALFVVLYAIANLEKSKAKQIEDSFKQAIGIKEEVPKEDGGLPKTNEMEPSIFRFLKGNTTREQILTRLARERLAIISADAQKLEMTLAERLYGTKEFPDSEKKPIDRVVYVARDPDGIRITVLARKFFALGSTSLDPTAKKLLDGIALSVKGMGRLVRIEGHTDNLPFRQNGMTNWELSAIRATAVTRYFIEQHHFVPGTIYAAGFSDTKPISANDTPENRALNRRIDIKLLYDNPSEYVPPGESNSNVTEPPPPPQAQTQGEKSSSPQSAEIKK
ncbi:MAG: flagellar motor protein MotB [Silvanigrellaceae bacterium]|nr:flagellar motor protein MotB [Silvanigrellaceae bacterium]